MEQIAEHNSAANWQSRHQRLGFDGQIGVGWIGGHRYDSAQQPIPFHPVELNLDRISSGTLNIGGPQSHHGLDLGRRVNSTLPGNVGGLREVDRFSRTPFRFL